MEYKDYYKTLGVAREASQDQIKQAYRRLARKYHPDINKEASAEQLFKEIGEAYEVLKDPEKRAAYDNVGNNYQPGQEFKPPPGWNNNFDFQGADYSGADGTGFSNFFEELFGRAQSSATRSPGNSTYRMQGENQHAKIAIRLQDAYHGAKQTITLTDSTIDQHGRLVTAPRSLNISIPKGIIEGQRIRLEGQGMPGMGGGPKGDLFLEIIFQKDPLFKAVKRDIHLTLPINIWEAALGATITAPTLGGKVQLKIPPNSQGGNKLRLKGRGLSTAASKGDQYVHLQIHVPEAKTTAQKNLFKKMAEIMPVNPRAALGG